VREGVYYFALYIHCAVRISVKFPPKKSVGVELDKLIGYIYIYIYIYMVISCLIIRSEKARSVY